MKFEEAMRPFIAKVMAGEYDMPVTVPPRTVLDIGANFGAFSVWAHEKWPAAKITAYEPQQDVFAVLKENAPFAECINRAVCEDEETLVMFRGPNNSGESSLTPINLAKPFPVRACAARDIPSHEFVKVDTEGCEVEILSNLDLSQTQYIALEYHRKEDVNELRALLFGKGFKLHSVDQYNIRAGVMKWTRHIQPKRILIANAIDAGAKHLWYRSMENLRDNPPCEMTQQDIVGDSLIPRARNALSAAFLYSDCSHILFIDSDIAFSSVQVRRLLSHDVPLVAAFYPKKQQDLQWVCNRFESMPPEEGDGLQPMGYMGTGFMLIARTVFEQMIAAYPDIQYVPDDRPYEVEWDFWSVGVYRPPGETPRYLSEDWYFCQRCHDLGIPVYGDTRLVVQHIGDAIYPLNSQRGEYIKKNERLHASDDGGIQQRQGDAGAL